MVQPPEIWGGVECTVNRVGDAWFDQLRYNGHDRRIEDLDRFKGIGLKALRSPFLWERMAPESLDAIDWRWADERLQRMRRLGLRPIAGFVHHGSGPRYTDLLDPGFGEKLARYAARFAERYPWVEDYTPVNEPFTTARFSALYGVWYPHRRDFASCARALLNEVRGTILSMRAIRRINPRTRLIQTDDLGKASGTPLLRYQVDFENERRWLGWDLLCGRVTRSHPLRALLTDSGVAEAELDWLEENACPPDVLGVNHYLLSNRHLDERLERYPAWSHGGNERHAYADVESVRIADARLIPPETILREAWERYRIPLAVTEVHVDAGREDQLRWLLEIWNACRKLQGEGADVRAICAWGLLGHFDWHCLVSRCEGYYESGVFDLRGPEPRPTALAGALRSLSERGELEHPLLALPGWWRRPDRLRHPTPVPAPEPGSAASYAGAAGGGTRPILITGARGTLGQAFARVCERRAIPYRLLTRQQLDIADPSSVRAALAEHRPWAVLNAAGYVRVDAAEREPERCRRENAIGPGILAAACAEAGARLVSFSSDLVFDGEATRPYVESSAIAPLNTYGRSKAEGEAAIRAAHPDALVVRTSAFFGPWDRYNFLHEALSALAEGRPFFAAADLVVSPTYVPDLAEATLNLLIDGERGLWHLANAGATSWFDLAREAARGAGFDPSRVIGRPRQEMPWPAARPRYSVLGSERGSILLPLDRALARYLDETHWRTMPCLSKGSGSREQASLAQ